MHHDLAEIGAGVEKLVANPQKVLVLLSVQGNAGPEAGVDEEVVSLDVPARQALEEV